MTINIDIFNFTDETKKFILTRIITTKTFSDGRTFLVVNSNFTRQSAWTKYPEQFQEIMEKVPDQKLHLLKSKTQIHAKIKMIKLGRMHPPTCPLCGNHVPFSNDDFTTYCSIKCLNSDPIAINKRKNTNILKYGSTTPAGNAYVMQKMKDTCTKKYGHQNYMHTEEFKQKSKNTCLEKYGTSNISQYAPIIEKRKQTNLERYGVTCTLLTEESKKKSRDTKIQKYGTEHEMHNPDYVREHLKTIYKSKQITLPESGETHEVQGYEGQAIFHVLKTHPESALTIKGIPPITYYHKGRTRYYHPDFLVRDVVYEVKCLYTWSNSYAMNRAKLEAVVAVGKSFVLMIYENGKESTSEPRMYHNIIPDVIPKEFD